jgi:cytochrome c551/c552
MGKRICYALIVLGLLSSPRVVDGGGQHNAAKPSFQTSDRCLACHNGIVTPSGEDVSIGFAWRSSMMGNSSRDPYWQGSVRRESIDHPESQAAIEDECSICHMPITRFEAKTEGRKGQIFSHLPFDRDNKDNAKAEDGVSCSVCHQIAKEKLGTPESYNGGFVVNPPSAKGEHPEYGPFAVDAGRQRIMHTSSGGFRPTEDAHIRDSALCGTCHTLKTKALGPGGKEIGALPEQMPYPEWLHSDYPNRSSCQSCHMPEIHGQVPITAVLGVPRGGAHQHTFVAANFFMLRMLNLYRKDLSVAALPTELTTQAEKTVTFLQSQSARVSIPRVELVSDRLHVQVLVQNLTGHKMPTAYPSRRAWLHVTIRDARENKVFESGALHADGSIEGNDNDTDAARFEPHYREITSNDQVQIYEPILKDGAGHVTTGLLSAVGYLKDNRLLPSGFKKETAEPDIAVVGDAADDPNFTDAGSLVQYSVSTGNALGPFHVEAELWYQPIGFRWAHNLSPYNAPEPQRFVGYYDSMGSATAVLLTRAEARH